MIFTPRQIFDQIKENEKGGTYVTHVRNER
jgi:hypothetical protein